MNNKNLSDVIVSANSTIGTAIKAINKNGVRGVFVCETDRELIAIVMDSDIRRATLKKLDLNASVQTIMKTSPFVINHNVPFDDKKGLFMKSDKILAPIVDNNGCVVDYISLADVLDSVQEDYEDTGVLPPKKVLIVGGAGYIGSVLAEKMLRMGYKVRVVDLLIYGKDAISHFFDDDFEFIRGDCRDKNTIKEALDGVDAVIHLGEIVGDPACKIDESFTIETNYDATQMIVEQCVKRGIKRFIFASSCSVYGQNDEELNEESGLNPVSLYARCKIESERAIQSFDYNHFCPTILRLATVHGRSFRQRFDLVINLLAIKAVSEGKIRIFGGDQWRPFISVADVCRGIATTLNSEGWKVRKQIFNLGDTRENYQLIQIAGIIKNLIPEVEVDVVEDLCDKRNYRVSFEKIKQRLGFSAEYKITDSVRDIISAYRNENMFQDYKDQKYHNVLALKEDECGL